MEKNNTRILLFWVVLLLPYIITSQTIISGKVFSNKKEAIISANILLENPENNTIITYRYTSDDGVFSFSTSKTGTFRLKISALGFETKEVEIHITSSTKQIPINVLLQEKAYDLDEIVIETTKPVIVKKDTILINASSFSKGTEEVVEDLLKNMPGIEVETDGTIKVNNKEVEKVMIEGDDFFEKGYKILTKSMPSEPIDQIEILQNYSNNRLLKGIEESDKVALNLKLKDDAKRKWFGNISAKYGVTFEESRYEASGNLMSFGKKNKYYFLTSFNNTGYDNFGGNINDLLSALGTNNTLSTIGDEEKVLQFVDIHTNTPNFERQRTNFNNSELLSLNAIFNPFKNLKIKTSGFLNFDEQNFFSNSIDEFFTQDLSFTNTQNYVLRNKQISGFAKLDANYDISNDQSLNVLSTFNDTDNEKRANIDFNEIPVIERLKTLRQKFNQKVVYTNRLKENQVFLLTGRLINEKAPQNYTLDQFYYQDLFPESALANNIQQKSKDRMLFAGIEAHFLKRKKNENLLEIQLGNKYRKDKLQSNFFLLEDVSVIDTPDNFQNEVSYFFNDTYLDVKYRYQFKNLALIGKLSNHLFFTKISSLVNKKQSQTHFFINPTIGFNWRINEKNRITSAYSYNVTNSDIQLTYPNYVQNSFRSFSKGLEDFNQLASSIVTFNYQLGDWNDRIFANTFFIYSKNHDFVSTKTELDPNYFLMEYIVVKDRELLSLSTSIDTYMKKLSSNIRLKLGFSRATYQNIVNSSDFRNVKSTSYDYGLEFRTGFKSFFNFHLGSNWNYSKVTSIEENSFINNLVFFDMSMVFSDKFNVQVESERYYFGNLDSKNRTYFFLDFDVRYVIKKNKLSLFLNGKNLFNTDVYKTYSINDVSTSVREYRLMPRFILLGVKYRF
jgi:hypothetical protein